MTGAQRVASAIAPWVTEATPAPGGGETAPAYGGRAAIQAAADRDDAFRQRLTEDEPLEPSSFAFREEERAFATDRLEPTAMGLRLVPRQLGPGLSETHEPRNEEDAA